MWLILVDRSASMGEQFAGFNGADLPGSDRFSRLSVAVGQLAARGAGLHGAKLMFFTTPELNWPVIDVDGGLVAQVPEPVGVTDVAGALDWARAQVVPLEPSVDVRVLLVTDLRTTPDTSQLRTAADALLRKATVHLILMDPNYLTSAMASEIAPGRVLLAASVSGLASTLAGLFPRPDGADLAPAGDGAPFPPEATDGSPPYVTDAEKAPTGEAPATAAPETAAPETDVVADWPGPAWASPEWTGEDPGTGAGGRDGGSLVSRAIAIGRSMKRVRR